MKVQDRILAWIKELAVEIVTDSWVWHSLEGRGSSKGLTMGSARRTKIKGAASFMQFICLSSRSVPSPAVYTEDIIVNKSRHSPCPRLQQNLKFA